jgi:hypothetical protein
MAAPAFKFPIPIENDKQVCLVVTSTLAVFVTCLFVALRLFAKFKASKPFDASDLCITVALVSDILPLLLILIIHENRMLIITNVLVIQHGFSYSRFLNGL